MSNKKEIAQKIRPYEGDTDIAREIAEQTGLDLIVVMSLALSAGLKAIKENNCEISLPLKMKVVDPAELEALKKLLIEKGVISEQELEAVKQANPRYPQPTQHPELNEKPPEGERPPKKEKGIIKLTKSERG